MAIPNSSENLTRSVNINSLNFLQELAMSKYLISTLKISGTILGLYCLTLTIVPTANANPATNISNATGANISNATGSGGCTSTKCPADSDDTDPKFTFYNGSTSSGSTGTVTAGTGTTYNEASSSGIGGSRSSNSGKTGSAAGNSSIGAGAATIALIQQFQSQLSTVQSAYESAAAKLAQVQSAQAAASKSDPVRYARVMAAECGCMNPTNASNMADELATARAAEAKAAEDLVQAQAATRKFLADAKNRNSLASGGTSLSPLW